MSSNLVRILGRGVSALSLLSAFAAPAFAQEAASTSDRVTVLDVITVKGEGVERSIFDTATSVEVVTEEDIEEKVEAAHVSDVVRGIPNVLYTDTVSAPVFRGVDGQGPNFGSGAFFGGTVPRARINVDGHNLSFYESVFGASSIWDVESVEVFRGPQTTTMGANSVAGAVIVKTKDPTFTPEGEAQIEYGSRNKKRVSAVVSGPLTDDFAARLALDYSGRDTFIDYTNPNFAKGNTDQDFETFNGRLKLLWEPAEIPGLEAKLTFSHTKLNRPTSEAAYPPYEDLDNNTVSMPSYDTRVSTGVLDIGYDFGNDVKLTNQFQYSQGDITREVEPWTNGGATIDYRDVSNETRINFGTDDSTWSGVAGIYYSHVVSNDTLYLRGVSDFDDTKDSLGLFSEVTWRFAERWALTGGLRYQFDHIQRSGSAPGFAPGEILDFDENFDALLPKISLAYDLTPDVTVGALVNRGYNPGGAGLRFATASFYTFEPETLWNYELFARARLLDDRLTLSGNLFYTDQRNSQRVVPDYLNGRLFGNVVVNAEKARSYGLEVSADYQVLDTLRIRASAGLLETEIIEFNYPSADIQEGNEFGKAPGYMVSLGADWDITPEVRLSGEVYHTDGYHSTDNNDPAYWVDSYTVANARVAYSPNENFQFYGFVNNIFDERMPTWKYDDRSASGIAIVGSMLEPRTFGAGMKVRF
ncbi:TonB-dependent receptor [Nitratireductor sp. GCM10026969]|uniref:TonB-dependent receptor n=1 Tax=Nitratireductor sp. GCM10026969 TaxID=3252645 RepID=UPI0036227676